MLPWLPNHLWKTNYTQASHTAYSFKLFVITTWQPTTWFRDLCTAALCPGGQAVQLTFTVFKMSEQEGILFGKKLPYFETYMLARMTKIFTWDRQQSMVRAVIIHHECCSENIHNPTKCIFIRVLKRSLIFKFQTFLKNRISEWVHALRHKAYFVHGIENRA